MQVTVVGSGNGGMAVGFEWAQHGHRIALYGDPEHPDNLDAVRANGGITSHGRLEGFAPVASSGTDVAAAMDGAEVVFVVGPAFAKEAFGRSLAPHLRPGTTVVIVPVPAVARSPSAPPPASPWMTAASSSARRAPSRTRPVRGVRDAGDATAGVAGGGRAHRRGHGAARPAGTGTGARRVRIRADHLRRPAARRPAAAVPTGAGPFAVAERRHRRRGRDPGPHHRATAAGEAGAQRRPIYGSFATVAGIFALLYLVSQTLVYAAEVAAVRYAGLWPRALDQNRPTAADARVATLLAREQERMPTARIDVHFVSEA